VVPPAARDVGRARSQVVPAPITSSAAATMAAAARFSLVSALVAIVVLTNDDGERIAGL
jgi:hypothetical protein